VGFGTPVPLLVGIVLILFGIGLLFLDTFKPGYKRDSDTVYAILFMLAGFFALLSWQADFQISLQLMISAGSLVALMVERVRNRSGNTDPVSPPMSSRSSRRDSRDERPSRSYRAGFDESPRSEVRAEFDDDLIPMEETSRVRRIRGGRDSGGDRDSYQGQGAYFDRLSEDTREPRRSQSSRRSSSGYSDETPYGEDRPRRSALQLEGDVVPDTSTFSDENAARSSSESAPSGRRRRGRSESSSSSPSFESETPTSSRGSRRRSRSNGDSSTSRGSSLDGDYVDYKPLGIPKPPSSDDDFDNSGNFDDNPSFR
jgi:Ycf66 protein N-terminus